MSTSNTIGPSTPASTDASLAASRTAVPDSARTSAQSPLIVAAIVTAIAVALDVSVSWRQSALFMVGVFAGLALYHAAFGFTSSWRVFISDRRGAGLRAQMLMLAATCVVFFPLIASGTVFGQPVRGSVSPAGVAVIAGAFMFGLGMQLGGGCASGTLFTVGGGSTRMLVTLLFFIVGSVVGTAHAPWWAAQPSWGSISLVTTYGAAMALVISLAAFAAIAALTVFIERRHHGRLVAPAESSSSAWLRGPWPLAAGAIALAVVNIATLVLAGRPWGVTSAFALWGAKAAIAIGIPVHTWPYWTAPAQKAALDASVLTDVTSVMNFGIVLGALLASLLAGRFAPVWRVPTRSLVAAVLGGLLLGYGARVAFGCNIGAYFSGIASGSLHGWLWLPAAFVGSIVGTSLRPMFGLSVERTDRSRC
jgi:uncharacterized membrane protein YedE/YeeE